MTANDELLIDLNTFKLFERKVSKLVVGARATTGKASRLYRLG